MEIKDLHLLFLKCDGVCTDTRKAKKNQLFFALKGEHFNGNSYAKLAITKGAKYAIIDEAEYQIPNKTILVKNVLITLQELSSYHRKYLGTKIIALTGSNGKTTTKELIHAVISQKFRTTATIGNLNNHIGVPLTLLAMTEKTEIGIVEMGANHQKEIEFLCNIANPDFGYITNFGKAHLEGFGGIEGVIKGKSEMYTHLISNQKVIFVNGEDSIQVEKTKLAKRYVFGTNSKEANIYINFIDSKPFVTCAFETLQVKSKLIGEYNFNNIAAAIAIGKYFEVDALSIKKGIEQYTTSNNRSQIINKNNKEIILDAYNANPSSMRAALLHFEKQDGHKTVILGDMFELGEESSIEHQNISNLALSLTINKIILIGENFYQCQFNSDKVTQFKSFESFKDHFETNKIKNTRLLIKGSRGMQLERVLDLL